VHCGGEIVDEDTPAAIAKASTIEDLVALPAVVSACESSQGIAILNEVEISSKIFCVSTNISPGPAVGGGGGGGGSTGAVGWSAIIFDACATEGAFLVKPSTSVGGSLTGGTFGFVAALVGEVVGSTVGNMVGRTVGVMVGRKVGDLEIRSQDPPSAADPPFQLQSPEQAKRPNAFSDC